MPKETIGKTIGVAAGVCVVCSVFVSTTAVYLKPIQVENQILDKKQNVLSVAGVSEVGDVDEMFQERIEIKVIDISTGEYVDDVDPETLDERKAAKDPDGSIEIQKDIAGIGRKSKYQSVYFTKDGSRIILPVHGKGLWSTMYGFVALDAASLSRIESFAFYEHGETPGLGGEVDNPTWKQSWVGKQAFDEDTGEPQIKVIKGKADKDVVNEVDGLSGATLTARGVENLVRFWLGEEGYGPFLAKEKQRAEGGIDG